MLRDEAARKARAMIARAEHDSTPESEASTARLMADKLIRKYDLTDADLIEMSDNDMPYIFEEKKRSKVDHSEYADDFDLDTIFGDKK